MSHRGVAAAAPGPLSHVVRAPAVPAPVAWLLAALLFGGLVAAVLARGRVRRLAAGAAAAGGVALALTEVLAPGAPAPPVPGIRLAAPVAAAVTSPMLVRVCSRGASAAPTDGGRVLAVRLDGLDAGDRSSSTFALGAAPGPHHLRIELVDPGHHAYAPPVTVETDVRVSGPGPLPEPPSCGAG